MRQYIRLVESLIASHGIEGLPDDVEIKDRRLLQKIESGRYRMIAHRGAENRYVHGHFDYEVEVHPINTDGMTPYRTRSRKKGTSYHDARVSSLHTVDPDDEYLAFTFSKPHPEHATSIERIPGHVIYRGMSAEEYQNFLRTGSIWSNGSYNIGDDQKGLTYWSTDPKMAVSYANSFAPAQFKPTIGRPAYVVAAQHPVETRRVKGTGEDEVGVARPITKDEVVAVWEGRVFDIGAADFSLRYDYMIDGYRVGSESGEQSSIIWNRIA